MNRINLLLILLVSLTLTAENPIITQRYTADPTGLEYNGRLYIYTSHDLDGQERYWMKDITCISTDDMQNWTDHGEVFSAPENISWVTQTWAPTVVERNDTFFMYTGDGNRSISVAIATSPTGPFVGVGGKPLITRDLPNANVDWCFDPTVFIDDDGQAYCVFGGGPTKVQSNGERNKNARIIKLGKDLVSTAGEAILIDAPGFYEGGYLSKNTVDGKDKYYFSYFTNFGSGMDIKYMMSDNPLDGWEYKGIVLKQPDDNFNNSHAACFSYMGKSYLAYHTRKVGIDRGIDAIRQRSVCVDELFYNADGTIKPVIPTREGPTQLNPLNPYRINQAECMSAQSYRLPGIETDTCFDKVLGRMVTDIDNGDWIKVSGVDFGDGSESFAARVSCSRAGGNIEIHLDSEEGELIGSLAVKTTKALNKWQTQKCKVKRITGQHDLFLKFTGDEDFAFNLNWWAFK